TVAHISICLRMKWLCRRCRGREWTNGYQAWLETVEGQQGADPGEADGARDWAVCVAALEALELPLDAVLAAILPLVGITGDIALDGAEAIFGPVLIATMLLPYMVAPPLVRQIRAEGERAWSV